MSDTDAARIELYNIAKQKVDERFAELLMKMLSHDPERHATKDDVEVLGANLRTEMAELGGELRTEMADLRTEMAELRTELRTEMGELRAEMRIGFADVRTDVGAQIHQATAAQTRTMVLGLAGSVTAIAIANTIAAGVLN